MLAEARWWLGHARAFVGDSPFAVLLPDDLMCDDAALLRAMVSAHERHRGSVVAFLDVTDPEPAPADSPLRRLPNVVLTSHIAGMAEYRIGRQAVDDVEAFLSGRQPKLVVTESMLDRLA